MLEVHESYIILTLREKWAIEITNCIPVVSRSPAPPEAKLAPQRMSSLKDDCLSYRRDRKAGGLFL